MVNTCRSCGFRLEKNCGRSSHRFPKPNDRMFKEWATFVGKPNDWIPPTGTRLCSYHFDDSSFQQSSSIPTLATNATPTIQVSKQAPLKLLNGKVRILTIVDQDSENQIKPITLSDQYNTEQQLSIQKLNREIQNMLQAAATVSTQNNENQIKLQSRIQELELENENLKQNKRSLKLKIINLKRIMVDNVSLAEVTKNGGMMLSTLVSRVLGNENAFYDTELKKFSTTIMAYSKRAYEYIRMTFNNQLPCPRTIRRLLSRLQVKPGFLQCSLRKIKEMSDNAEMKIYCTLVYDEMHIRNQALMNSEGEIVGFVDYGDLDYPTGGKLLATSAMFVMAVALNGNWKLPIGYFLTDGLPGDLMKEIIQTSLRRVHDTGVRTIAVSFDGLPANLAAVEKLGAKLSNPRQLVTHFPHPSSPRFKVNVIPDPPHMLKLMRNLWTSPTIKGILLDKNNQLRWDSIVQLHKIQTGEGVRAANGLTSAHINFKNQKMKVSYAAKIFSQSVSKSLELCKSLGLLAFHDVTPLCGFLDTMDRGFDLLNVRHPNAVGRKSPLTAHNQQQWKSTIADMRNCLFGLKNKSGKPILETQLKTGPLGFLIALESVQGIMGELVCTENPKLKYLITYKFCQDHLETLFSSIRACGGFNDNPNTIQLQGAIKSVLSVSIAPSLNGNCLPLDDTHVPQIIPIREDFIHHSDLFESTVHEPEGISIEDFNYSIFSEFTQNVTSYIAGNIVKKILPKIQCIECQKNLVDQCGACVYDDMKLIDIKQNGGLVLPSRPVVMICRNVETTVRYSTDFGITSVNLKRIEHEAFQICFGLDFFYKLHAGEKFLDPFNNNHKVNLTKMVIHEYAKIRLHHYTKKWTRIQKGISLRQRNTKNTLFQGM